MDTDQNTVLRATNIRKSFGALEVLKGVDLTAHAHDVITMIGASGSGKSTFLRCMNLLEIPDAGTIAVEGEELTLERSSGRAKLNSRQINRIRSRIGMVFQSFNLWSQRTVLDNVMLAPVKVLGVPKQEARQRAEAYLAKVGLFDKRDHYPAHISGGQQQRVGIARSLAVEPELWFLDEPFSALDPLIRREMQDEFMRLQSVLKKTIVFITHDFDEAIRLADRIAIMKDGAVVQVGTPEEIVLSPADAYVAEFTRNVAKAKVVRARSLMRAPNGWAQQGIAATVPARATVAEAAPLFGEAVERMRVVDAEGATVGILERSDVVGLMMKG